MSAPEEARTAPDLVDKPDGWPDRCGRCGAPWSEIGFDYADGFNCRRCGGSDADE